MTCSVNMYIITNKYDWRKRPPPWHVLCLSVLRRYAECIILNCFQYLRDTFLRFHVTEVHYTTPRRTWVFRERGVYSLLCVSGAPLMRVWGISRTSGDQNHHFDAKINIACASLGQKSHKLWGSTQDFAGDPNCCAIVVQWLCNCCAITKKKPHPRYLECGFVVTPTGLAIAARCLFLMFVTAKHWGANICAHFVHTDFLLCISYKSKLLTA